MAKNIPCPKCDGHGIISEFTEYSVSVQTCTVCDGLGHIEAPMSNADRIRAMSDEEIVSMLGHNSLCDYVQDHSSEHCEKQGSCDRCLQAWLQQPAEDRQ